jgi:outer membrane receptor protein involved in Fe transport
LVGDWTVMWRHEGQTTTLQAAPLPPFSVVDANVQRDLVNGIRGFVSVENIGNTVYWTNVAGTGASAVVTDGLPRTVRIGVEAYRF